MTDPIVSIVMPVYNARAYICKSFDSILDQSMLDWELIAVDDGSSDGSAILLQEKATKDPRVRVFQHKKNMGVAAARNLALEYARGVYIAFLDSDDIWHPDKLMEQVSFMKTSGCDISYTNYQRVDAAGLPLSFVRSPSKITYRDLLRGNGIGLSTAMYRKAALIGLCFKKIHHEDYVFWLDALRRVSVAKRVNSISALAYYRVSSSSLSSSKRLVWKWQWAVYRKYLKVSVAKSAFYFLAYVVNAVIKRL
jgi:glycosyltransferase involved in cell wall biosynthesis